VEVESFLTSNGIAFRSHEHPPVLTCDELAQYGLPGLACKNLFLRDQKKRRFFLVVLPAHERTDLAHIGEVVGERKLSFASPESLLEKLGVTPGAVSPLGLLNDTSFTVEVFIHRAVMQADTVHFHPNRNTASLELTGEMFQNFTGMLRQKVVVFI
jgi:Ala-tRNA(Pro) deacylase